MTIATSERIDARDQPWPMRPWIMATIAALAARMFWEYADAVNDTDTGRLQAALATFIAVATVSFILTVEVRRWAWSLAFALGWGAVIGFVGYTALGYNHRHELAEWPFLASLFAVLLAAPLFQAARDEGARRFPPMAVQMHAWTDAVIGAAALAFVGISFALFALIAGLFNLIGITWLTDLLEEAWFGWMLAGFAFGAAIGILRERDALVGTMQRLVRIILSVLAPVLAFALVMFLLSLPLTGLAGLWDGWVSAAALTLLAAAGCFILLNAATGPSDDVRGDDVPVDAAAANAKPAQPVLLWSAMVLALVVLPLALLADAALLLRVGQYGWTPERIWGVLCALIATAYGLAGWWAVIRQRRDFSPVLRTLETRLAIGVCLLALLLSLPIVDFGAISARDQMARLQSGAVKPADFDWQAMAFDFGPAGRATLRRIARSGPSDQRLLADAALKADNRWSVSRAVDRVGDSAGVMAAIIQRPAPRELPAAAISAIGEARLCRAGRCIVQWVDDRRFLLAGRDRAGVDIRVVMVTHDQVGDGWSHSFIGDENHDGTGNANLETLSTEVRAVSRKQLFVDGVPMSDVFE